MLHYFHFSMKKNIEETGVWVKSIFQINPNQYKDKFEIGIIIILRSGKDLLTTRPVHK